MPGEEFPRARPSTRRGHSRHRRLCRASSCGGNSPIESGPAPAGASARADAFKTTPHVGSESPSSTNPWDSSPSVQLVRVKQELRSDFLAANARLSVEAGRTDPLSIGESPPRKEPCGPGDDDGSDRGAWKDVLLGALHRALAVSLSGAPNEIDQVAPSVVVKKEPRPFLGRGLSAGVSQWTIGIESTPGDVEGDRADEVGHGAHAGSEATTELGSVCAGDEDEDAFGHGRSLDN